MRESWMTMTNFMQKFVKFFTTPTGLDEPSQVPITLKDIDRFKGSISPEEAETLAGFASQVTDGDIVEIGSWRGKSAIALCLGIREISDRPKPKIFCIDPHVEFTGVYGGKFSGNDRRAFYKAMLDAGCAEDVALVNLPSVVAARAWANDIAMLFIDGDHTLEGVQADADSWLPLLKNGSVVAFDDAKDESVGPFHVVKKLIESGDYKHIKDVGKISFLQKV